MRLQYELQYGQSAVLSWTAGEAQSRVNPPTIRRWPGRGKPLACWESKPGPEAGEKSS